MSRHFTLPAPESFSHQGRRIAYRIVGEGPRTLVFTHGLLMDVGMFTRLAPMLAQRGHRVVLVDMLGHGASDQPRDMTSYSMPQFGADVVALLDHLNIEQAVIGGTSLGANVSLEAAVAAPGRIRALVIEMPVLEHGLTAAALLFVPLALALRVSHRGMGLIARLARLIPRTHFNVDVLIDFIRRDPLASLAVLDGITFGRVAPPSTLRRTLDQPTLVIGHGSDPIHPFTDAGMLTGEMPNARLLEARSIWEWRVWPSRLDAELLSFLDEAWAPRRVRRESA